VVNRIEQLGTALWGDAETAAFSTDSAATVNRLLGMGTALFAYPDCVALAALRSEDG
jgi:hypothetical protein